MDRSRPGPTTRRTVAEVVATGARSRPDTVVTEEPLEIRLEWPGHRPARVAVTMRTPGRDFDLAAGFLFSEGVIADAPKSVRYCVDRELSADQRYNVVTVALDRPPLRHPARRSTVVSSACGVCGTQTLDEIFTPSDVPLRNMSRIRSAIVGGLPDALADVQPLFSSTGSLHAAGVFDYRGKLRVAREDIGRHNAVDKVLGARLLGLAAYDEESILCVSGRVGFDIMTKAVVGRISTVVAVGGPSSLALRLADRAGVTVCGFARGGRYVVYANPERIDGM